MSKRFVVAPGDEDRTPEFVYPADAASLKIIRDSGGLSKMTDEQRSSLKFKTVHVGDDCTDMPEPARGIYLERGWIVEEVAKAEVKK